MLRIVCCLIVYKTRPLSSVASSRYAKMFGKCVRKIREARGLSQEDLAYTAGLHRTHVSLIERGQRSVRIETIEKLAKALHTQPSELMPRIELSRRR